MKQVAHDIEQLTYIEAKDAKPIIDFFEPVSKPSYDF